MRICTEHEEHVLAQRCRNHLSKQGYRLVKRTDRSYTYYHPSHSRYAVIAKTDTTKPSEFPLSLADVMTLANVRY